MIRFIAEVTASNDDGSLQGRLVEFTELHTTIIHKESIREAPSSWDLEIDLTKLPVGTTKILITMDKRDLGDGQ